MTDLKNRRPLKSRNAGWAQAIARRLAHAHITPNHISGMSVVFAAFSGLFYAGVFRSDGASQIALLLAGGVFVQLRLLCNLFDGMVAVEGGRGTATGPFWNEVPDRVADALILVGVGVGAGITDLGWAVASLAIFISYLRAFGASLGQEADYAGPMAKPQRMATVTVASLAAALLSAWVDASTVLQLSLWIVICGGILTGIRRIRRILAGLAQAD